MYLIIQRPMIGQFPLNIIPYFDNLHVVPFKVQFLSILS